MKKKLLPKINLGLATLSILISCACMVASCKVGNGGTTSNNAVVDTSDNSINGIEECQFECEPVDADFCNDSNDTNNVCFAVSLHCRGSGSFQGPDFTTTPPAGSGCVVPGLIPPEPPGLT